MALTPRRAAIGLVLVGAVLIVIGVALTLDQLRPGLFGPAAILLTGAGLAGVGLLAVNVDEKPR